MTTLTAAPSSTSLTAGRLAPWAPWALLGASLAISFTVFALGAIGADPADFNIAGAVVVGVLIYMVLITVVSSIAESRRKAVDRLMTALVSSAFVVALLPLISLLWTVIANGIGRFDVEFFTYSMRNIVGEGGGIYHAIIGTVIVTAWATLISVPVGVLAAVYLIEYGAGSRMARIVTFLVDVMTGIPSIVAGLFAYALFVLFFGPGVRMGIGGAVALSVLMLPIVVRSTEEMLKLVPDELREASYALGVPKWRTITKVVLPTAMAGIVTGVTLAVARVAGETAPLLIIAGDTDSVNFNAFAERMATLPVFIYYSYMQPGIPPEFGQERAWGAALVLIAIVMALNILARFISRWFAPKTGR
jgi:phosphate transport system permease protein